MIIRRAITRSLRSYFSTNKEPDHNPPNDPPNDYSNVHINSDRIQKRMQEIQRRKASNQKPNVSDLMPQFNSYRLPPAIEKFRRETNTQDIFKFQDADVKPKHDILNVDSFAPGVLEVNDVQYPPSLILYNKQVLVWQVPTASAISLRNFDILKILDPKPQYIILAVNNRDDLKLSLQDIQQIKKTADIDILQLFQGIGTFNMSSQDQIKVALFIISE